MLKVFYDMLCHATPCNPISCKRKDPGHPMPMPMPSRSILPRHGRTLPSPDTVINY